VEHTPCGTRLAGGDSSSSSGSEGEDDEEEADEGEGGDEYLIAKVRACLLECCSQREGGLWLRRACGRLQQLGGVAAPL
jgi:hypothetical protein